MPDNAVIPGSPVQEGMCGLVTPVCREDANNGEMLPKLAMVIAAHAPH